MSIISDIVAASTNKTDLRQKIGDAINVLVQYANALDMQLARAPVEFAAADPDYAAFVEGLPLPADPNPDPETPPAP